MNYLRKIKKTIEDLVSEKSESRAQFTGILGNHGGVVDAGDDLVYMTLQGGQVIRLLNRRVPNFSGRSVVAGYDPSAPNVLQVLYARDAYGNIDVHPSVPNHHETHEYPGHDTIFIKPDQFLPFLTLPVVDFTVQVFGGVIRKTDDSGWAIISNQQVDLSSYVPSAGARYALIDAANDGTLSVVSGTLADSIDNLTINLLPEPANIPMACIRLYDGQDRIRREKHVNDFVEVRSLASSITSSGGSGGAFQRVLSADLTLDDGEALVTTGYINTKNFSLRLKGDAKLHIV